MADPADDDLQVLKRLRVLHLDKTERAIKLDLRWRYYAQRQHDESTNEFDGRARQRGLSYFETKQRGLGFTTLDLAAPTSVPMGSRRPNCPTSIAGEIVDTYTAMLLGEGRCPAIKVAGDPDSTTLLAAMMKAGYAWDALAQVRKRAGATGASAILPEIVKGELCFRGLQAEHLYVEWLPSRDWVPRLVIEQKRVEVEHLDEDSGAVTTRCLWRTRAWDQTHAYVYEDVDEDHGIPVDGGPSQREDGDDTIELAEAPLEHGAGRCPVIWLQNTRDDDDPIGEPDYEGVFEQIDRRDHLRSMIFRGTIANNDPTLVIKDKLIERKMWPMRAKGHGQKIELSEVGDAMLLEMSGKTIETSWLTDRELKEEISDRVGLVSIKPDQAGALQSGVALQILRGTQNNRVAARRPSLTRTITQLCRVLLTLARKHGLKDIGAEGKGIELAPIEIPGEDGEAPRFELPTIGTGNAIDVAWGELHSPTPTDLQQTAQALGQATGAQPVLSQETGIAIFAKLSQTGVDAATELGRIRSEADARVASFESSMTPDADAELGELIDGAPEPEQKPAGKVEDVQKQALNGAQQQALMATLSAAGITLSRAAALFTMKTSIPDLDEAGAVAAIEDQIKFAEEMRARQNEREPVPKSTDVPVPRGKPPPSGAED